MKKNGTSHLQCESADIKGLAITLLRALKSGSKIPGEEVVPP